jgi:hypothetical protein
MASEKDSRSSTGLDLRVTSADVAALRSARQDARVSPEDYARMLAQLPVSIESLRARNHTRGERFRL